MPDPSTPNAKATTVGRPSAGGNKSGDSAVGSAMSGRSGGTGMSSLGSGKGGRQTFAADELAIVLSHYDTGVIEAIQEFPRGSRKAPKLVLRTESGIYLLKRRAKGKEDAFKVAFCHALQLRLAERQFPLPHLIGTKKDNNSMLKWRDGIYELFEYIKGSNYDSSLEATADAGKILALFHKLLADYQPEYEPPTGSYHLSRSVQRSFELLPESLTKLGTAADEVARLSDFLHRAYKDAAKRVIDMGLDDWPKQIVHSDWHPGNMLFRGSRVVAVIDYDAARMQQRVLDVGNGALQFSILGGGDDASEWPEYVDESRFKRFLRGYDSVPDCVLSRAELQAVPWLMIEALIAESVIPIAATGYFARMQGHGFLKMVERKVHWLQKHADHLVAAAEG